MNFHLSVFAETAELENKLVQEMRTCLGSVPITSVKVELGSEERKLGKNHGQLILVQNNSGLVQNLLPQLDRRGRAVFAICEENSEITDGAIMGISDSWFDELLTRPFRRQELLGRLKHCQQILMWEEVSKLNASFSELIQNFQADLKLAERLQKDRLPIKFPEIKGLKVNHRYLAGLKSGGDYFDLAESPLGHTLSMVLSKSTSYGLSSAVLSVLMRVALRLTSEEAQSSHETVKRIQNEIRSILGEKDQLNLFYGVISRRDYLLRYINLGSTRAFYANMNESFRELDTQHGAITKVRTEISGDAEILLQPEGRLTILSDGYIQALGGVDSTRRCLDQFHNQEAKAVLNELAFQVKGKLSDEDMPDQDCTAVIFDVDSRLLRLAKS